MDLVVQPQVVCAIKLWYQKMFMGILRYIVWHCLKHWSMSTYIIGHIFVYILSNFKSLPSKRKVFNCLCVCRKTL